MGRSFFNRNKEVKSPPSDSSILSTTTRAIASRPSFIRRIQDPHELHQVFDKFDTNGDGMISSSELHAMLSCFGSGSQDGSGSQEEELKSMMQVADLDGDGFISLEEFISVNTAETDPAGCLDDLRNAFSFFDVDNNGLITAEELHRVLCLIGEKTSMANCKSMIQGVDQNGDGAVNFEEFTHMMTRSTPSLA